MNEQLSNIDLAQILLAEMGKRSALECAMETMLMVIGTTKPEQIEPIKGIFQQLAEDKWDALDDHSKPAFQNYASRLIAVLDMTNTG